MTAAGIVLYNPDTERLKENIEAILPQVDQIIVVDNGSSNVDEICELLNKYEQIKFIWNEENYGIAKALNQLLYFAYKNDVEWILTIDQDSVCK